MRVKKVLSILFLILMFTTISVHAVSLDNSGGNQLQPRYVGVKAAFADIDISSSGRVRAFGKALLASDYVGDLTVSLFQDGTSITSWKTSGDGIIELNKYYYVTSGHDYYVAVSIVVYNTSGNLVDSVLLESNTVSY